MNLFARIMSHGFALVVVALLATGLIYRGELFPEWELPDFLSQGHERDASQASRPADDGRAPEVEPAESAAAPSTTPMAGQMPAVAIERDVGEPAAAAGDLVEPELPVTGAADEADTRLTAVPEAEESIVPTAVEEQAIPAQPAAVEAEEAAPEAATPSEAPADARQDAVTSAPGIAAPAANAISREKEAEAAAAATAGQTRPTPAVTPYKILAAAREAYWLRDYAVAEQKYRQLIDLDPDNPDGYGELGNMYFSQGDWDKASSSYYEAGTRLAAQGLLDRARQMVEVIRGLNGTQAGDLEQQINASESIAP